jgi:hypothetical protein
VTRERIADAATGAAWTLWGLSLTTVNELLTTLSLVAAIFCSICAGLYYLRKRAKLNDGR